MKHFFTKKDYKEGDMMGKCTFLHRTRVVNVKRYMANFKCFCGNIFEADISQIKGEIVKSCGCIRWVRDNKVDYKSGDQVGNCQFVRDVPLSKGRRRDAIFLCECGNEFKYDVKKVKDKVANYCGLSCSHRKAQVHLNKMTHGQSSNEFKTPEYAAWRAAINRCTLENTTDYHNYGGRGIIICERWINSFENFFKDMGERPSSKHSLDRYPNVNGNYEPNNCRWATMKQQQRNKRNNVILTYNGESYCISEWAERLKVNFSALARRVKKGWSHELVVTTPVKEYKTKRKAA